MHSSSARHGLQGILNPLWFGTVLTDWSSDISIFSLILKIAFNDHTAALHIYLTAEAPGIANGLSPLQILAGR